MKTPLSRLTLLVLAAALSVAAEYSTQAQDQPAPDSANAPTTSDNTLPPGIDPASPTAQVIKLTQAGSDVTVINAYVANSPSSFNLDADAILSLKDAGVPTDVINGMMNHDKNLTGSATVSTPTPAPTAAPAPTYSPAPDATMPDTTTAPPADGQPGVAPDDSPDTAPPAEPVTVEYFDNTLSPYGSWVYVEGYGRCWRPTTVIYDSNWSPYCDRGHWVYTDCGWYWNSDYAWGATFHYGRWFRNARVGWCWMPDTQWAPSWVTWRSANDYCGWAPLPPFTVYTPGIGFFFRGARVGVDFDFGLGADAFVFLSPGHLCDRRPRAFCVDRPHVGEVFRRTTVENHFDVHNRFIVNTGISVDRISAESHRHIEPIRVAALPTARREGWRGPVIVHQTDHGNDRGNFSNGNNRFNNHFQGNANTPDNNHGQHFDNHPINQNVNGNHNVDVHQNNNLHSSITPTRPNPTISEFNNQAFIAPRAPAPPVNNSGNQHQNNAVNDNRINGGTVHNVPTPHTSAPENFSTPPAGQRFQQNQPHDYYSGQTESHNYNSANNNNRSEPYVAPSVNQAPRQSSGGGNGGGGNSNSGGGGGQSHSSGSSSGSGSGSSSGSGSNSGQGRQGR